MKRLIVTLAVISVATGASRLRAQTPEPAVPLPAEWTYEPQVTSSVEADRRWWKNFGDPQLTDLIDRGMKNSLDLRQAMRRIEMSRNAWRAAQAGWYP